MQLELESSYRELKTPRKVDGFSPKLLFDQVINTIPFVFEEEQKEHYLNLFLNFHQNKEAFKSSTFYGKYFEFHICAHFATVASFVPTDVDIHIRWKQWHHEMDEASLLEMLKLVIESYTWDFCPVSTRWLISPNGHMITGHKGEWLSIAAAGYAKAKNIFPDMALTIFEQIHEEVHRVQNAYTDFKKHKDGISLLKTATLIAHNLGDLDRVIDQWNLKEDDLLRKNCHKLGTDLNSSFKDLFEAGNLNRHLMAAENHRNLPLRKPRALRKSRDFLIAMGPFHYEWGLKLGKHLGLSPSDLGEICEALVDGLEKVPGSIGYSRALAGILDSCPGGAKTIKQIVPAKIFRKLSAGTIRNLIDTPETRFKEQWNRAALKFVNS